MIYSLFGKDKFSKLEKKEILKYILGYSRSGNNLNTTLKFMIELYDDNKRVRGLLNSIEKKISQGVSPSEVFYEYGLVSSEERFIISVASSEGIHKSIDNIFKFREIEGKFPKVFLKVWFFSITSVLLTSLSLDYVYNKTIATYEYIRVWQNIKYEKFKMLNLEPDIFQYHEYFKPISFVVLFLLISTIAFFLYYSKTDRSVLYKISKLFALNDIPRLFNLMNLIQDSGKTSNKEIFEIMLNIKSWKGLIPMFKYLEKQNKSGKSGEFSNVFEMFNFPKQVTIELKSYEQARDFWSGIKHIANYSEENLNDALDVYKFKYLPISLAIAVFVPLFVYIDIGLSIFELLMFSITMKI